MTHQLLVERHLLELRLVNTCSGGAKQSTGGEEDGVLHIGLSC